MKIVARKIIPIPIATTVRELDHVAHRADHEAAHHERQEEGRRDPEVAALLGSAARIEEVGHHEQQCGQGSESILRNG